MQATDKSTLLPVLAATLGIAIFVGMDAAMKELSITISAYSAMVWRVVVGTLFGGIVFLALRLPFPPKATLQLHMLRGSISAVMATTFFWGISRVPLAEGTALSFIAPLLTLYLAAVLLKEKVGSGAIIASALGMAGVFVILAGKMQGGAFSADAKWGVVSIFISAILYAYNLILQRQQAQIAGPFEIVFFQNLVVLSVLSGFLLIVHGTGLGSLLGQFGIPVPDVPALPDGETGLLIILSAALAMTSLLLISWAYARAEAQVLVPVEYTAFVWAALFGWMFFSENLTLIMLLGTALIVAGCIIAARRKPKIAESLVHSLPAGS
jgi:S-adenosylmethionine uptake transporter